jgi:RNA polymerase sigma-70 factor (ECF subfamily)
MSYGGKSDFESGQTLSTSSSLLERVKSNDPTAWQRLVEVYGPLVYRWSRDSGLQGADAKDIAQEVFTVLTRKMGDFRRDRPGDSFRAWLKTITLNKIRDYGRKQGREAKAAGGTEAQQKLAQIPEPALPDSVSEVKNQEDGVLEAHYVTDKSDTPRVG